MSDVFVAGDIARHPNPIAGPGVWTSEHWGAAVGQAGTAARNMVSGTDTPHGDVPVFWTMQFGHVLKAAGEPRSPTPCRSHRAPWSSDQLSSHSDATASGRRGRREPGEMAAVLPGADRSRRGLPLEDPTVDPAAADTRAMASR